jgi:hypothetical protein
MKRDARAFLWDIQQAADAILRFVAGLDIRTYAETELVHSAVERKRIKDFCVAKPTQKIPLDERGGMGPGWGGYGDFTADARCPGRSR